MVRQEGAVGRHYASERRDDRCTLGDQVEAHHLNQQGGLTVQEEDDLSAYGRLVEIWTTWWRSQFSS